DVVHRGPHSFPTRRSSDLGIITQDPASILTATTLDLAANGGSIGTQAQSINTVAGILTAHAVGAGGSGGDVFVSQAGALILGPSDRKSTRLNSSHLVISYA